MWDIAGCGSGQDFLPVVQGSLRVEAPQVLSLWDCAPAKMSPTH